MSIENKFAEAKEVDIFAELSHEEKMEADLLADIAIQIHTRRMELGMTQAEFAKHMDVAQTMVSKWESGSYNFTLQKIVQIYSRLGLSVALEVSEQEENVFVKETAPDKVASVSWRYKTTKSGVWNNRATATAACCIK